MPAARGQGKGKGKHTQSRLASFFLKGGIEPEPKGKGKAKAKAEAKAKGKATTKAKAKPKPEPVVRSQPQNASTCIDMVGPELDLQTNQIVSECNVSGSQAANSQPQTMLTSAEAASALFSGMPLPADWDASECDAESSQLVGSQPPIPPAAASLSTQADAPTRADIEDDNIGAPLQK